MKDPDPSSERLRDSLGQSEVLRPREHEPPGLGIGIDLHLHVGEQVGSTLHLVEDHRRGILGQKRSGVIDGELSYVERLERYVPVIWKARPA